MEPKTKDHDLSLALGMIAYSGQQIWNACTAIAAINAILFGFLGASLAVFHEKTWVTMFCLLGVSLCLTWAGVVRRGFGYHRYYFAVAREIEGVPPDAVNIFRRGAEFGRGDEVRVGGEPYTMPKSGIARVELLLLFAIAIFASCYFFLGVIAWKWSPAPAQDGVKSVLIQPDR